MHILGGQLRPGFTNMYVALAIPAVVIVVEKLFHWHDAPVPASPGGTKISAAG